MHLGTEGFVDHVKHALQDAPLQEALHLLTTNFAPRRVEAMAALGNAEELRTRARPTNRGAAQPHQSRFGKAT